MNKDRILKNSLDIIRKYLNEEGMTLGAGTIAGTPEFKGPPESKLPPVHLKKGKKEQNLFRRQTGAQQKFQS
jgi:hypothetical protein